MNQFESKNEIPNTKPNKKLKPCKSCKQLVAKSAKVCPHCGEKLKMSAFKAFVWVIFVLATFNYLLNEAAHNASTKKVSSNSRSESTSSNTSSAESDVSLLEKIAANPNDKKNVQYVNKNANELVALVIGDNSYTSVAREEKIQQFHDKFNVFCGLVKDVTKNGSSGYNVVLYGSFDIAVASNSNSSLPLAIITAKINQPEESQLSMISKLQPKSQICVVGKLSDTETGSVVKLGNELISTSSGNVILEPARVFDVPNDDK
jgi:hypothetical protein